MAKWKTIFSALVMAGLALLSLAMIDTAVAKQPNPIEFEPMATRISDGNGGKNTIYMVILLQPKRAREILVNGFLRHLPVSP